MTFQPPKFSTPPYFRPTSNRYFHPLKPRQSPTKRDLRSAKGSGENVNVDENVAKEYVAKLYDPQKVSRSAHMTQSQML